MNDLDPAVALTQKLIRIDRTSGEPGEADALRLIADWFGDAPAVKVTMPLAADETPSCLIISPSGLTEAPVLLFSAHVDSVPVGDVERWQVPPFSGHVDESGVLHGRGSVDMISGLAAAAVVVREAIAGGAAVALAISRDEERGCRGADDVATAIEELDLTVGAIIVGEPTGGRVHPGHRGPLWIDVRTTGRAAHGSTPERGESAIAKMTQVLTDAAASLPLRDHAGLGSETVNIGTIRGGSSRNIVPESCVVEVDLRTSYADPEPLLSWWRHHELVDDVIVDVHMPAVWTPLDDPWFAGLPGQIDPAPLPYGTDASVLTSRLAVARVAIWGPGDPALMHVVDERIDIRDITGAVSAYREAVERWS